MNGVNALTDGVTYRSEDVEALLLAANGGAGIGELPMFLPSTAGDEWALLGSGIADRDNKIETLSSECVQTFRVIAGMALNTMPTSCQCARRKWIDFAWSCASAERRILRATVFAQECFRHL